MSSSAPVANAWAEPLPKPVDELKTYLAILPDFKTGSKRVSGRMEIRPKHLENSKAGHGKWIINAGATFSDETAEKTMTGSWFLMREESMEKALARLGRDVYAEKGAWDMSAATIQHVAVSKH